MLTVFSMLDAWEIRFDMLDGVHGSMAMPGWDLSRDEGMWERMSSVAAM